MEDYHLISIFLWVKASEDKTQENRVRAMEDYMLVDVVKYFESI